MKIGIISVMEGYPWGGSEELWADMAEIALQKGDQVAISYKEWQPKPHRLKTLEESGAALHYRNSKTIYPSVYKRMIGKLINKQFLPQKKNDFLQIFDQQPDKILINEGSFANLLYFPELTDLLKDCDIPFYILSEQNKEYGSFSENWILTGRNIFSRAKGVFFVSEGNWRMAELFLCTDLPNAKVVRNPVNLSELGIVSYPEDVVPTLACVGRLECRQKAQDLLLRALKEVSFTHRFKMTFYGSGPDENYLQYLTDYLKLNDCVQFAGYNRDVRKVWAANQLLILPSHSEGMPLSVVEAMLCGRSCLVTDVAGNKEWIEDGVSGFITESNHVPVLSAKIKNVLNQFSQWKDIGVNAHDAALKNYDSDPGKSLYDLIVREPAVGLQSGR